MSLRTRNMLLASIKTTTIHSLHHNLSEGFIHLEDISFQLLSQVTNNI